MFGYQDADNEKVFLGYEEEFAQTICDERQVKMEIFASTFEYPISAALIAKLTQQGLIK